MSFVEVYFLRVSKVPISPSTELYQPASIKKSYSSLLTRKPVIKFVAIKRTSIIIIWKIKLHKTIKNQKLSRINISRKQQQ